MISVQESRNPACKFTDFIATFDNEIENILENIPNLKINLQQRKQASLPVSRGGLGIRRLNDISLPAFDSSS